MTFMHIYDLYMTFILSHIGRGGEFPLIAQSSYLKVGSKSKELRIERREEKSIKSRSCKYH